ncbi:hypothetical protein ACIF80_34970 [Streptomyces sp. NPDC085927]|uniref:hypothetical protein n=1 Tax=Streptomyces sp. NPDC085927 TaxID=3365738 RepID=UPI0037D61CDD
MDKKEAIQELVAGFDTYAAPGDLSEVAAGDAPASAWGCVSFLVSVSVSTTVVKGC